MRLLGAVSIFPYRRIRSLVIKVSCCVTVLGFIACLQHRFLEAGLLGFVRRYFSVAQFQGALFTPRIGIEFGLV